MGVSAGANIGERLMGQGERHYELLRETALRWMQRVELEAGRIDDLPAPFLGRHAPAPADCARNLVTRPRLVLMDEPTSGPTSRCGRGCWTWIRLLVSRLQLSVVIVTHDLGVAACWPAHAG